MRTRASRPIRAFTLVEVLVVVVLLAIIAGIVVPMAVSGSSIQAVSAARALAADIQYAQSTAITEQTAVRVEFSTNSESYSLLRYPSELLIHPMTKNGYVVSYPKSRALGEVDLVSANFGGSAILTFDETGAPSSAGSVSLRGGSIQYRVDVAAGTGRVTVAEEDF